MVKLPPVDEIERLVLSGASHREIAERFDVTAEAVRARLRRANKLRTRPRYSTYLDWKVEEEHRHAGLFERLKDIYLIDQGEEVPEQRARYAENLRTMLEKADMVLAYGPDVPPNEASSVGGFALVSRKPGDGKYHRPWGNENSAD